MTPQEVRQRRADLGLTIEEFAWALDLPDDEVLAIEKGEGQIGREFIDALDRLEERVFGTYVGA